MKNRSILFPLAALPLLGFVGCNIGPRMIVVTGTTIGLHASPGDMQSRPPSVTFAYKRSELAIVPTAGSPATEKGTNSTDAYSAFCAFYADMHWFGTSTVSQAIATGHAAREIVTNAAFISAISRPIENHQ